MTQPGVNLEQLVEALKRKGIPLPFEMGTFVALEACERIVAGPVTFGLREIWLSEEGEVTVAAATRAESEEAACRALVELVGQLLVQSAPGVPPALLAFVERGPSGGEWSLRAARDDLEAALVPLNRAATRRVLSRLLRETRREGGARGRLRVDEDALESELDDFLGVDPSEPGLSPRAGARAVEPAAAREGENLPASHEPLTQPIEPEREAMPADGRPDLHDEMEAGDTIEMPAVADSRVEPILPTSRVESAPVRRHGGRSQVDDLDLSAFDRSAQGGHGLRLGVALVVAAALLVAAYLWLGREGARETLGMTPGSPVPAQAPAAGAAPTPPVARESSHGQLHVTSTPARAQVLLHVGEGPVVVEDLPVGIAHEFVAIAEGTTPARAVVPPDASWEESEGRLRYELALQTTPATEQKPDDELGATALPRELGKPTGAVGDVRVITSPPGAQVYLLVGFTPDARVENVALDAPADLLLYLRGHELARVSVAKDDYESREGALVADVDVELKKR